MRTTTLRKLERERDAWNALYPVGTPVEYWTGVRGDGEPKRGEIRARATIICGHVSCWVTGLAGCINLSHVQPLTRLKCLTVYQPWASALACGLKTIETRGYPAERLGLRPGDLVAIHAAARRMTADDRALAWRVGLNGYLGDHNNEPAIFPYSAVLCVLRYMESAPVDYSPGRWGWRFEHVKTFEEPIPAKGRQGAWIWDVPEGVTL